jgi:hypothetical protein
MQPRSSRLRKRTTNPLGPEVRCFVSKIIREGHTNSCSLQTHWRFEIQFADSEAYLEWKLSAIVLRRKAWQDCVSCWMLCSLRFVRLQFELELEPSDFSKMKLYIPYVTCHKILLISWSIILLFFIYNLLIYPSLLFLFPFSSFLVSFYLELV